MNINELSRIVTSFIGIWLSIIFITLLAFNTRVTKWTCFAEVPLALVITWAIWKEDGDGDG